MKLLRYFNVVLKTRCSNPENYIIVCNLMVHFIWSLADITLVKH